jgi:RNA polymerase sigma factor (sigma-70 family)
VAEPDFSPDDWTDPARRRALIERLSPEIARTVSSTCWAMRRQQDIDDQIGEMTVALLGGAQQFPTLAAFFSYVITGVKYNLRAAEKKQRRRVVQVAVRDSCPPDEEVAERELVELVFAASQDPADPQMRAVRLRELEGLSFDALAAELGVSRSTAHRLRTAGIRALRAKFVDDPAQPNPPRRPEG